MADNRNTLKLTIEVDDKGSVKVKQFADESKKAFDQMQKGPQAAQGPLDSLKESWMGLTAKVAAATAVLYGVQKALSSFVNEAAEAEQIENRLRYALETTGYTWHYAKQAVDEFANSVQKSTRFSDEQARQALTDMMLYTNDFARAQMGAKLAMDMSIRTGQDLGSTSRLIGMAMSGNVEMLGRYIPQLRNLEATLGENAGMAQKAEYALKILQEKFGGTAQSDLNSYTAILAQFKNAWSDLKETLGMYLLPTLKDVFVWFRKLIDIANEWAGKGKPETVLGRLRSDLKEAEQSISIYEEFLRRAETAKPGHPYRLGPEATQEAKERLHMWKDWARYLREQIKAEEDLIKATLAAETQKDIFPDLKAEKLTFDPRTIVDQVRGAITQINREYEALGIAALEANEKMIDAWDIKPPDIVDQVRAEISQVIREYEALGIAALDANQQMIDAWDIPSVEEILAEIDKWIAKEEELGQAAVNRMDLQESTWRMAEKNISQSQTLWENLGQTISDVWASNVSNMIKGAESAREALRNIFAGISDAFISAVTKMIIQWLLFESVIKDGKTEQKFLGGGSGIGMIVGAIGKVIGLQEGGRFWVNRPTTLLVGEGGKREFVSVTPEDKMGGINGQQMVTHYNNFYLVQAIDPESMDRALRNRSGTIVKIAADDIRAMGLLRNAVKGA